MKHDPAPKRLDIKALALARGVIAGREPLSNYERILPILREPVADLTLEWSARFDSRTGAAGKEEPWLCLDLATSFPLVCQRCLGPVDLPVSIAREFRFVASEAVAEEQDDGCEEDLLVQAREFNLAELVEDELLMALPLIPRHESCPLAVRLSVADDDFDAAAADKPKPFAALSGLLKKQ